jgi:hypothetical protein
MKLKTEVFLHCVLCAGTSLTMHYAMDDANDVLVAYKQVRHTHSMRCTARAQLAEAT